MHICLTGSNSFIGRAFLRYCDQHNITVTGIDLVPNDRSDCVQGDITTDEIANLIPQDVDAIVHLAALSKDPDCRGQARKCFDSNVMATLRLMDIAAEKNCKQFVFASSEWVYSHYLEEASVTEETLIDISKHTSEYALSKLVSEANLRQRFRQGFCDVTILRFGIVYGPRESNWCALESLMHQAATQDIVLVGSGDTARQFIHVDDVARGIGASLGHSGFDIFNIQGEQLVTLRDVVETSATLFNRTVALQESNPDAPSIRTVSGAKAAKVLGFTPEISLQDGIRSVATFLELV